MRQRLSHGLQAGVPDKCLPFTPARPSFYPRYITKRTEEQTPMCRSIKTLRRPDLPATPDEVEAAALQFVRKVSGFRQPSARNATAFNDAVRDITEASQRLLDSLTVVKSA